MSTNEKLGTCNQQFSHDGAKPHTQQGNCNNWSARLGTCESKEHDAFHPHPPYSKIGDAITAHEAEQCASALRKKFEVGE